LADGVIRIVQMDAQPAKFLLHLQHFELASACPLYFPDQWFQVLREPPQNVEPSVVVSEAPPHQGVLDVSPGVEPSGSTLDHLLLKCLIHPADGSVGPHKSQRKGV
jgi:hypothetical protein